MFGLSVSSCHLKFTHLEHQLVVILWCRVVTWFMGCSFVLDLLMSVALSLSRFSAVGLQLITYHSHVSSVFVGRPFCPFFWVTCRFPIWIISDLLLYVLIQFQLPEKENVLLYQSAIQGDMLQCLISLVLHVALSSIG